MEQQIAVNGGTPIRTTSLPNVGDISGRDLGDAEIRNLTEAVRSGNLFRYGGRFVQEFEKGFAELLGIKHALGVTSGTAALHVAVATINPEPGDEIITTPITDMGTIAPILMQNAIPIFADLDLKYYTMLPESIEARITKRTKAIIAVHLFGQPCDMDAIMDIAKRHNIAVIEDCAQAYLAEYKGKIVGTMGDISCFSLQQSKQMMSGDGGIVVTNNDDYAAHASLFADKGWPRQPDAPRDYLFLGINYRMNELTGAVATAQLGKISNIIKRRRCAAEAMTKVISTVEGVNLPAIRENCKHSWWQYPITIDEKLLKCTSTEFAAALSAEGIPASVGYIGKPIYMCKMLQEKVTYGNSHFPYDGTYGRNVEYLESDCPNTLEILKQIIILSCNEFFSAQDINDIGAAVAKVAAYYKSKSLPSHRPVWI